jgi:hypothetical protein
MYPRIEDKTTISRFVLDTFEIDKTDFAVKFNKYQDPFLDNAKALVTECEGIVATSFYLTQLKTLTRLVDVTAISIRGDLNEIEQMAVNAGNNLKMNWKEMGFKEVRNCISTGDVEGMLANMKVLNKNIELNLAELTAEGMTDLLWNGMKAKAAQVKTMNEEQNKMMAAKAKAVKENNEKFEEMWNMITNLARAGKVIFKLINPVRAKEYTISTLIKRVRHDEYSEIEKKQKLDEQIASNKGQLELTIKDFGIEDSWVEEAEIEIQGTEYKVYSDEEGFTLLDLPEGIYTIIIRKETYEDQVLENVKIVAGETTELTVEMKGIV